MARHRSLRGFAGLGNAAGSKAVESVRRNVLAYRGAFRDAQMFAGTEPAKALAAVAKAKKALVDAEAGIMLAKAARVMVPSQYVNDFKTAAASVGDLNDLAKRASDYALEMRQVDPEWDNPRYGAAMPDFSFPRADVEFGTNLEGYRGRRGCCARKHRRGRR